MLSNRYLHLHEALGLGPMWLRQRARVRPANGHVVAAASSTHPAVNPASQPVPTANARQAILAALNKTAAPATVTTVSIHYPGTEAPAVRHQNDDAPLQADTLPATLAACRQCPLHAQRRQPLPGHGNLSARLLVISPNPAPQDDIDGHLFSGDVGVLLANMLRAAAINLDSVYYTSMVKCTPNVSLKVDNAAETACRPTLQQQLGWINPAAVLLLGQSFAQHDPAKLAAMLQNRPYVIVAHPAQLLRQGVLKAETWQALQQLAHHLHPN